MELFGSLGLIAKTFLYLFCFSNVIYQGFQCFKRFRSNPEAVEQSYHFQPMLPFPALTFCPLPDYRKHSKTIGPFNVIPNNLCNVSKENARDIFWISAWNKPECQGGQLLQEVFPKLEDFGIKSIDIWTFQGSKHSLDPFESFQWREIMPLGYGRCFSMVLPEEILQEGIAILTIKQDFKEVDLIFHTKGVLKYPTLDMGIHTLSIKPGQHMLHKMRHECIQLLRFGEDHCNDTNSYDLDQCIIDQADKKSMDLHGCSTIFGNNPDLACTDNETAKSALRILNNEFESSTCLNPCKFLTNSMDSSILVKDGINDTITDIFFHQYVKNVESKYIYNFMNMVAEFGGYVGLFLGFSLLHLNDFIAWIWSIGIRLKSPNE